MSEYDDTAEDIATIYGISVGTVNKWAREGYPVRRAGEIIHVQLQGCQQVGVKLFRFNKKAVVNFISNINDQRWASFVENTKQQMEVKKSPKTGRSLISSTMSDSAKQLRELVASRKGKRKSYVTI